MSGKERIALSIAWKQHNGLELGTNTLRQLIAWKKLPQSTWETKLWFGLRIWSIFCRKI